MGNLFEDVWPSLAVGGAAGSGVLTALSAQAQGRAIQSAANTNAKQIELESAQQAARIRTAGRRELGKERAALGTSGLQAAGSPLELIAQNASEVERQAMETTLAGGYSARVERGRGAVARKQASRISAASLLEGGVRAGLYGRSFG